MKLKSGLAVTVRYGTARIRGVAVRRKGYWYFLHNNDYYMHGSRPRKIPLGLKYSWCVFIPSDKPTLSMFNNELRSCFCDVLSYVTLTQCPKETL